MTVRELRERLAKLPQHLPVVIHDDSTSPDDPSTFFAVALHFAADHVQVYAGEPLPEIGEN